MISGSGLLSMLVTLVVVGLICWVLWWLIGFMAIPEPFNKVARVLVALIAVVFVINLLLGITGHPLFRLN